MQIVNTSKDQIEAKAQELKLEIVKNEYVYDINLIKYLLVGDHPGDTEKDRNRYFVGSAGTRLKSILSEIKLVNDFDSECMLFNKSKLYSKATENQRKFKKQNLEFFNKMLKYTAREISKVANELNKPILIFGKSELKKNGIFDAFYVELNEKVANKELIHIYCHPSYSHFLREWKNEKRESKNNSKSLSDVDLLFQLGRKNFEKIK